MTMTGKHEDDGGVLSLFAKGSSVAIVCSGGHFWLLNAEQHDIPRTVARIHMLGADGIQALDADNAFVESLTEYVDGIGDF